MFCRNKHLQSSLMVKCAVALLLLSTCIYVLHRCVVLRISFKSSHHQAIRNSIDNFLFLTAWNGYSIAACFLLLPYTLIWIAFDPALLSLGKPIRQIELSYGIYLWGFPIQQIIAATVGEQISVALAMGLSMVGALLGSYANQLILATISKIRSDIVQAVHSPSQQ